MGQKYDFFLYFTKNTFHLTDMGLKQYIWTNKYFYCYAQLLCKTSLFYTHYSSNTTLFFITTSMA